MKSESLISSKTIQAYRETEFRVFVEDAVGLKISENSEKPVDLFKGYTQMGSFNFNDRTRIGSTATGLAAVFNAQSKNIRSQCEA